MKNSFLTISFALLCFRLLAPECFATEKIDVILDLKPTHLARFDRGIFFDFPNSLNFEKHGGKIVDGGISGQALSLGKNEYLSLDAKDVINPEEGTITFWIRPSWSDEDKSSHTFISFTWEDPRKSYFVISKGWWERDGGTPYTYFIFNNTDFAKTENFIPYTKGNWTHIACAWRTGSDGFFRLYANGLLVAESHNKNSPMVRPSKKFYIGADLGTPIGNERWGDCVIDELAFFNRALLDDEVQKMFKVLTPKKYDAFLNSSGQLLQTRAIFEEGMAWATEEGVTRLLGRIKNAGFNVFVPCVWHGKGARYPSKVAVSEGNSSFITDPLKRLITLAHSQGVEVHPWFTVALRQRDFYKEFYDQGTPAKAFNVHNPAFREFIADVIIDVVARYEVDGINLDFIRSMGICTSATCRDDYRRKFNRELITDLVIWKTDVGFETHVQQWIDQAITAIVSDVSNRAKSIRPSVIISVDGAPLNRFGRREGRDEIRWANTGLIDAIFHMDYNIVPDYEMFNNAVIRLNNPQKLIFLAGNYDKDNSRIVSRKASALSTIIKKTTRRWPWGIGVYLYSMLTDEQVEKLLSELFSIPAIPAWRETGGSPDHSFRSRH